MVNDEELLSKLGGLLSEMMRRVSLIVDLKDKLDELRGIEDTGFLSSLMGFFYRLLALSILHSQSGISDLIQSIAACPSLASFL